MLQFFTGSGGIVIQLERSNGTDEPIPNFFLSFPFVTSTFQRIQIDFDSSCSFLNGIRLDLNLIWTLAIDSVLIPRRLHHGISSDAIEYIYIFFFFLNSITFCIRKLTSLAFRMAMIRRSNRINVFSWRIAISIVIQWRLQLIISIEKYEIGTLF